MKQNPLQHLKESLGLDDGQMDVLRSKVERRLYRKGDRITALSDIRTHNL